MNLHLFKTTFTAVHVRVACFYLLWASFLFILTRYLLGNYYEVYEFIHPATLSGELLGGHPSCITYPIANVLIGGLYVAMYSHWPDVPWYDLIMAAIMITSVAAIFTAIYLKLAAKIHWAAILFFNTSFFFLFIAESIVNWNITRGAFIACIAAFIVFALRFGDGFFSRGSILRGILNLALFIIGLLIRPEVAELIFILMAGYLVCEKGFKKSTFISLLPFGIPVVLVAAGISIDRHTSSEFYKQLNPLTEYQMSLGNIVSLAEMKTPEDSAKYLALKAGIKNDPQYINIEFVERMTKGKTLFDFSYPVFQRAMRILGENLSKYSYLLFFSLFIVSIGTLFLFPAPATLFRFWAFNVFVWLMLFGISYFMTMESRLMAPLLVFYTCANFIFLVDCGFYPFGGERNIFKTFLFTGYAITVGVCLFNMGKSAKNNEGDLLWYQQKNTELEKQAANKILVTDARATQLILQGHRPFRNADLGVFKKIILVDAETSSLTPAYRSFLDQNCHCNSTDLAQLFDYLQKHKDEVIIVANPAKIALFQSYLRVVHKREFPVKGLDYLVKASGPKGEKNSIRFYSLE